MYIHKLNIRSLRCIKSADLSLQYPGNTVEDGDLRAPNVNVLLGNNGTGKTTVLRAAALAVLAPILSKSAGYVPYSMVRRGDKKGSATATVELHEQDFVQRKAPKTKKTYTLELEIRRERAHEYVSPLSTAKLQFASEMYEDRSDAFLVVGYGATRRVEDAATSSPSDQLKRRVLRYQRVAGLFEPHVSLMPLASWLPALEKENRGRHTQVVKLIQDLLPEDAKFKGKTDATTAVEYLFSIHGVDVPFGALSDGYRAYIGWIADLLYHVCNGAPPGSRLDENHGIVLIDEIDLNLHPEWQRTVVSRLAKALPNLQFLLTTHSPIVAGSVQKENIFVMELGANGSADVKQYEERIYGLDAQQVLLSSYFGLETTRAPGAVDEMRELASQLKPGRSDIALQILKRMTGETPASRAPLKKPPRKLVSGGRAK